MQYPDRKHFKLKKSNLTRHSFLSVCSKIVIQKLHTEMVLKMEQLKKTFQETSLRYTLIKKYSEFYRDFHCKFPYTVLEKIVELPLESLFYLFHFFLFQFVNNFDKNYKNKFHVKLFKYSLYVE